MKLFEKKDTIITIEEDDLRDAKLSSVDFTDIHTKKRAFLNVLGARLAMKMLFSQKIEANNLYSLYTIHNLIEELDIADIYSQGIKIDVRVVFNREEIFIPKTHFEWGLLPDLYLVLELNKDFLSAEFLGFFEPKILNTQNQNKDFYFHEYDRLSAPKNLKTFLNDFIVENNFNITEDGLENAEELFISLADKEISQESKIALFKQLANDISLREKIVEFENFEILSKEAAKNQNNLLNDDFLGVVGAQQVFEEDDNANHKAEVRAEVLYGLLDDEGEYPDEQELNNNFEYNFTDEDEDNTTTRDNLGALAAGAVIGGAVVGGIASAAAAAEVEGNLAKAGGEVLASGAKLAADVISTGIDLGSDALKSSEETFSSGIEPDNDLVYDLDEDDLTLSSDSEQPHYDTELEELNEYGSEDLQGQLVNDLPELNELETLEELDENLQGDLTIEEKYFGNTPQETKQDEDVYSLDDFDFNELEDDDEYSQDTKKSTISFGPMTNVEEEINSEETFIPENIDDNDATLQKFKSLEDDENDETENVVHEDTSDDFISQVDEFLKDAEFSDEQRGLLEQTLDLGDLESTLASDPVELHDEIYSNSTSPENFGDEEDLLSDRIQPEASDNNDQIKLLFNEGKSEDMPELAEAPQTKAYSVKDKKMIIAASIATVVLMSAVITSQVLHGGNNNNNVNDLKSPSNIAAPISQDGQAPGDLAQNNGAPPDLNAPSPSTDSLAPPPPNADGQQAQPSGDMGKAVSDAFLSEPVNATISKVAWEVPEDCAYNDGFRKFLQTAGKNIKLNLQNSLLLATEMAYSNKVVVDLNLGKDGTLLASHLTTSSGSKQIDKIVLQSVKEALMYLKMPSGELKSNSVSATLIINF